MKIFDNYELWTNYTFRREQGLSDDEIKYWSMFHRWPLVLAVYLSMGQIPFKRPHSGKMLEFGKRPTDPDKIIQLDDFEYRLDLAKRAVDNGELVVEKIPDTRGMGQPYVERLVPVRNFIQWAIKNYVTNYDPLFKSALSLYKSPEHTASGAQKGDKADKVKELITEKAIEVLDAGCQCHNTELARYLTKLKKRDKTPMFTLPGIIEDRYQDHFNEAVIVAFRAKGIPLKNEPKAEGEPRGKKYCRLPNHKLSS